MIADALIAWRALEVFAVLAAVILLPIGALLLVGYDKTEGDTEQ